ncbi:MAG: branched-chain amino acid ABC transporter permease [Chloroflexota bacterium]
MKTLSRIDWLSPVKTGVLGGSVALFLALVGLIEASHKRPIIPGVLSMGQTLLLITLVFITFVTVRRLRAEQEQAVSRAQLVIGGTLAGLVTNVFLAALVLIGGWVDLRSVFVNASLTLYEILTLKMDTGPGLVVLLLIGAALGAVMALILTLAERYQRAILLGLGLIPTIAVLNSALFAGRGVSILGAVVIFVVSAAASYFWSTFQDRTKSFIKSLPPKQQQSLQWGSKWVLPAVIVLLYPLLGSYPSEVMNEVGRFLLMGLGLNIVVGFAGLLDLGYVAFFALGAYTMGVLTSPEIAWLGFHLTFWEALPIAVLVATLAGIVLGIPVLGMRGDYLAIVTLGFGEIIQRLAVSDWLKPYIGGSNGITLIPKATLGPIRFDSPQTIYYLFVAGILVVAFISQRVKFSRLGRAWMALREDEDVAEAMGIDLVRTKLLAFATGAAFAGLSGAIFASKLASIYPHSFHLLISINVLCLIIVGGMGNIPGVIVGALFLVGLPEILREFAEYRLLMYGVALVIMMLLRPEGLLPEARRQLELHEAEGGAGD